MSYPQVRYRVYNGTSNAFLIQIIQVSEAGVETKLPTDTVTRALLTVLSTVPRSINSEEDSSLISWNDTGLFTVRAGGLNLEVGTWRFRLIVGDEIGLNHQLIHEKQQDGLLEVTDTTTF